MSTVDPFSRYPYDGAKFVQLAASAEAMIAHKEIYDKHKDFVFPAITAFGPMHKKPTNTEETETETITTFDLDAKTVPSDCRTHFELVFHGTNVHCGFQKAELWIDNKVVDTITRDFLQVYHDYFHQPKSENSRVIALPFYCDRYDTFVTRPCVVKVYTKKPGQIELRALSAVVANKEKSLLQNHVVCYDQVVPLALKNPQRNEIFVELRKGFPLNATDIFILVTKEDCNSSALDLVKEYSMYYGETIIQHGHGYLGHDILYGRSKLYHLPFSTKLDMGKPYKYRSFNCVDEQHEAMLCITYNDHIAYEYNEKGTGFHISAFALVASHV